MCPRQACSVITNAEDIDQGVEAHISFIRLAMMLTPGPKSVK